VKIAIVGYGSMGKLVEQEALKRGFKISAVIDPSVSFPAHPETHFKTFANLDRTSLSDSDVVVDFSHPSSAVRNIKLYCETGIRAVIGTTGWYDKLDEVQEAVRNSEARILWASNFSVGVNLFFRIVEAASSLLNNAEEYDIWGYELHHHNKADSPSGTAKTLSEILLRNIQRKTSVVYEKLDRKILDSELHFASIRGGAVNFEHTLAFDSAADSIVLKHSARDRTGYASGALRAAEWIVLQPPGLYGPNDFMQAIGLGEK